MTFETLGERLRKLRGNQTQLRIAEAVGIDNSVYSRMEAGEKKKIDPEVLTRLADYHGVTIDYLMGRSDVMNQENQPKEDPELYKIIQNLSEEQKELAKGFLLLLTKDRP